MKGKFGGALFMILFSLPFAGVGVGAAWVLYQNVADSIRAQEWLIVKAHVQTAELVASRGSKGGTTYRAEGSYQYAVDGKNYIGTQLGLDKIGGSDNIGDWHENMAGYLKEARAAGKPITVYVNPDKPDEAVVDRNLRWPWLLFVGVFALLFGGAGLGILAGAIYAVRAPRRMEKKLEQRARAAKVSATPSGARQAIRSDGVGGVFGLWLFAAIWNLISIPAALLAVPKLLESKEYWGLFVLLFPLIGVLVLWGAIHATVSIIRRGSATLDLEPATPAAGVAFNGVVTFSRDLPAGERYNVELACLRRSAYGSSNSTKNVDVWSKTLEARTTRGADGRSKLAFRHQAPANQPPTTLVGEATELYSWRIEVERVEPKQDTPFGFDIEMGEAPAGAAAGFADHDDSFTGHAGSFATAAASQEPDPFAAPAAASPTVAAALQAELVKVFGAEKVAQMPQATRELMAKLTPGQRAASAQIQLWFPRIIKIVVAIVMLQFIVAAAAAIYSAFNE